jgi:hypothetical protein
MATIEHVRNAMHRQPFLGFTVRLVDGRSYHVKHRDFISVPETPRGLNDPLPEGEGAMNARTSRPVLSAHFSVGAM